MTEKQPDIVTYDIDGVWRMWPMAAIGTAKQLRSGQLVLAPHKDARDPHNPNLIKKWLDQSWHTIRPQSASALASVTELREVAQTYQQPLHFGALTGRTPELHGIARKQLQSGGFLQLCEDRLFMNDGTVSSYCWKERKSDELVQTYRYHLHLEDDARAAAYIARRNRANPDNKINRVVFLLKPRWAERVDLSEPGLIVVDSALEAAKHYEQLLKSSRSNNW